VAGPLTPDRLARVVAAHDLSARVAACEDSPSAPVCHGAHQRRRLIRAGQAQVYQRVMPGLPVALAAPFFRLALAKTDRAPGPRSDRARTPFGRALRVLPCPQIVALFWRY